MNGNQGLEAYSVITANEVASAIGLKRRGLKRLIKKGLFPKPEYKEDNTSFWITSKVAIAIFAYQLMRDVLGASPFPRGEETGWLSADDPLFEVLTATAAKFAHMGAASQTATAGSVRFIRDELEGFVSLNRGLK
jgi:predicted DNA-binding transcriptional regulator AlpA